jgi:FKBP-type peptidyl-prolyl cis-trans isomerase
MKKLFLFALSVSVSVAAYSQTGTKPKPPVKTTPAPQQPPIKTNIDSISYAIGVSMAGFYKEQGITNINTTLLNQAIKDVMAGKKLRLDEGTCNSVMNQALMKKQAAEAKEQEKNAQPNIAASNAFLQTNKQRPEVKTTASGLQYEVIKEGTGVKPVATDNVTCHYKGTLVNGTEFDNSYTRGEPITFALNRVIPGWTEGLQLMSVGSKYKLYIPHTLGYGAHDNGPIPGGSALIFEVELLDVKKNP